MSKILAHIHTGPENPTKAALGLLVGLTAQKDGHDVTLFLAGDAVHLLAPKHSDVTGLGTGRVGDHLEALKAADVPLILSGKSAQARGYDEALIAGYNARFGMPSVLIEESTAAETVLCY